MRHSLDIDYIKEDERGMNKWIGKKQVLLAALVVALGLAVYLNYSFAGDHPLGSASGNLSTAATTVKNLGDSKYVNATTGKPGAEKTDYFTTARKSRETSREEGIELLQDTLADVTLSEDARRQTLEKLESVTDAITQEARIESLLVAKGFEDCVVYLSGDEANVVVKAAELSQEQTCQILDIVLAQSDASAEKVNISAVKN